MPAAQSRSPAEQNYYPLDGARCLLSAGDVAIVRDRRAAVIVGAGLLVVATPVYLLLAYLAYRRLAALMPGPGGQAAQPFTFTTALLLAFLAGLGVLVALVARQLWRNGLPPSVYFDASARVMRVGDGEGAASVRFEHIERIGCEVVEGEMAGASAGSAKATAMIFWRLFDLLATDYNDPQDVASGFGHLGKIKVSSPTRIALSAVLVDGDRVPLGTVSGGNQAKVADRADRIVGHIRAVVHRPARTG